MLNPEIDTKDYVNVNNPNARDHVVEMILDLNLVDVWQELNLEKRHPYENYSKTSAVL